MNDSTTISGEYQCDFVSDCADSSDEQKCGPCTFESTNTCGCFDASPGQYKWLLLQGNKDWSRLTSLSILWLTADQAGDFGPSTDHTTQGGQGHYFTVEPSTGSINSPARLYSNVLRDTSKTCKLT